MVKMNWTATNMALSMIAATMVILSCGGNEELPPSQSTGFEPDQVFVEPRFIISEAGITQAVIESKMVKVYESRDTSYTSLDDSLVISFFDESGEHTSTLTADRGEIWGLYSEVDSLKATGNVHIRSKERNATLDADAVRWIAQTKRIYGEGIVTLQTDEGFERGVGFEAMDDLSEYRFRGSVEGEFRGFEETPEGR